MLGRDVDARLRGGTPRPPHRRPAGRRHRATRAGVVRRPGRLRQDHDAGRPDRLVDRQRCSAPDTIAAITFNKRAAEELGERLDAALAPLGVAPRTVRVRTFHALGREILRDAGAPVEPLVDRAALVA